MKTIKTIKDIETGKIYKVYNGSYKLSYEPSPVIQMKNHTINIPTDAVTKDELDKIAAKYALELAKALEETSWFPPVWNKFDDTQPLDLKKRKDPNYPHACPKCKGPAYIGLNKVDCKSNCK